MNDDLGQVTAWLLAASAEVGVEYFQLPVAEKEQPEYRERVYCYELYHRWRSRWGACRYSLGGEVDKRGHPIIRGAPKPDFLVHVPGSMENLVVMEVKPGNASLQDLRDDVAKLTYFTSGSPQYHAGFLWIYGLTFHEWARIRGGVREYVDGEKLNPAKIYCFVHERPGTVAAVMAWE